MNFSLLERIAVGALLSAWLVYGSNFLGNIMVDVGETPLPGAVEEAEAPPEAAAPEEEVDFASLLAAAEPGAGERVFNKCKSCHTIEEGGRHAVGPNLHNVIGADVATKEGFDYSPALTGIEGQWDYEKLNEYLEKPTEYAPGTKMNFAGLAKPADRANVIAYLRENTKEPPPLPEPQEKVAAEPEAPGEVAEEAPGEAAIEAETPAAGEQQAPAAEEQPPAGEAEAGGLEQKIAAATPEDGQKVFRKCQACHTAEQGAPHRVGPNLYGVLGRDKASAEGYNYSSALTGLEGEWTVEDMAEYLKDPRAYAPGTKMTFAGLKSEDERAAVIAYLRQHGGAQPPTQ